MFFLILQIFVTLYSAINYRSLMTFDIHHQRVVPYRGIRFQTCPRPTSCLLNIFTATRPLLSLTNFFRLINYQWEIAIFFTIKSLPNYLLYPVNEIPLEDIFLSCAKFNEIKIFEKPMLSLESGYFNVLLQFHI